MPPAPRAAAPATGAAATLAHLLTPRSADVGLLVVPADVGGRAAFQDLVGSGALRPLWGDVAAPARVPDTPTLRALAVRDLVPLGTVLAGRAAAWVLCGSPAPRVLDVVYPPGRHRPGPLAGRAPRQSHVLRDDRTLVAGVLVTSVVRTALDVATRCEPDEALSILRRLRDVCGLDPRLAARSLELRHRWAERPRARRALALLLAGEDDPV
ncbi:hypothetical protein H1Q78_04695 [Cellulosimicrobium cellulans]|uniref:hypothetical protein n=1 Tax=Cellulosimicrobium cellulans TaxID=1710 RepID=UPI001EDA3A04|nr:hypothetical protein [Cellulosimicrobium cellulans]UKJ64703.1 hypothetical protein H1Q78_04695 [Cellulosimicrobium cellulans]